MPSAKPRVSVTITDQLQKTLNSLWSCYPDLEGHLLESIQFLMIYGAEAVVRDRIPKQGQGEVVSTGDVDPLPDPSEPEETATNPDDEWA